MSLWAAVPALCQHILPPFWTHAGANKGFQLCDHGHGIGTGPAARRALDQAADVLL